ncbi:MAG: hypothetical protein Q9170_007631 [Blastenia crenularia]
MLPPYPTETASRQGYRAGNRYGNYATEEEYLAALREWAEEKSYVVLGGKTALTGFYGRETMRDYASREGGGMRVKKKEEEREWEGHCEEGMLEERWDRWVGERDEGKGDGGVERRRKSNIGQWLSRRRTRDKG